jgi:RNA polymerase-binding protein DksA
MESYLSSQQLTAFKQQLQSQRVKLLEQIRQELLQSDDQRYIELAGAVHDRGEEAVADLLYDIELASIDRHIKEAAEIEAALLRMAAGSFGLCMECEGKVGDDRLTVNPTAKRCYDCQQRHERHRQNGEEWPSL